jgi:hypothetical protein
MPAVRELILKSNLPVAKTEQINDKTEKYEIKIAYPVLSRMPENVSSAINREIKSYVDTNITEFKKGVADNAIENLDYKSALQIDFEKILLNERVISYKITNYQYVAGMAHPMTVYHGLNYDLENGKMIKLEDLFNPGEAYLAVLSLMSHDIIKTNLGEYYNEDFVKAGLEPVPLNFSEFVLKKDGLELIFNVYQVAPYAAGVQLAEIKYADLKEVSIKSDLMKSTAGFR